MAQTWTSERRWMSGWIRKATLWSRQPGPHLVWSTSPSSLWLIQTTLYRQTGRHTGHGLTGMSWPKPRNEDIGHTVEQNKMGVLQMGLIMKWSDFYRSVLLPCLKKYRTYDLLWSRMYELLSRTYDLLFRTCDLLSRTYELITRTYETTYLIRTTYLYVRLIKS